MKSLRRALTATDVSVFLKMLANRQISRTEIRSAISVNTMPRDICRDTGYGSRHNYAALIMTFDAQALANNMPEVVSYARDGQTLAITSDFGAPKPHRLQMVM
jgi:hypothetical protein